MNLVSPKCDISEITRRVGRAWGMSAGASLSQYVEWSNRTGLLRALAPREGRSVSEVCRETVLNEGGAEALIGVLISMGLVESASSDGRYVLTDLSREYLVPGSPYHIGEGLFWDCTDDVPGAYLAGTGQTTATASWSTEVRLAIQHSRNFAPSVTAARSGVFDGVTRVVDVAGGSGTFAIPVALDNPAASVFLVEQPTVAPFVAPYLRKYGVADRVTVVPMDVFQLDWGLDASDVAFLGNFLHDQNDDDALVLLDRCSRHLTESGVLWVHEVLFDERPGRPQIAALWNANMIARGGGGVQRTYDEVARLMRQAGFTDFRRVPTSGGFSLVGGRKAASRDGVRRVTI